MSGCLLTFSRSPKLKAYLSLFHRQVTWCGPQAGAQQVALRCAYSALLSVS
jgi:hypothetical protein